MSTGYTINKMKNGDLVLFGGHELSKPETIEIGRDEILDFVETFAEYLDVGELERLQTIIEDLIDDKASEEDEGYE